MPQRPRPMPPKDAGASTPATAPRLIRIHTLLVVAVPLAIFGYTLYPAIPGGDSGELVAAACTTGMLPRVPPA